MKTNSESSEGWWFLIVLLSACLGFGFWFGWNVHNYTYIDTLIVECQSELPRDQNCIVIAVPEASG